MVKQPGPGDEAIETVRRLARTPGPVGPLIVALGVTGWLIALHLVEWIPQAVARSGSAPWPLPLESIVADLIIGIAVFLGFWVVAPIAHELDLRHVLTRSVLVTGIAASVAWIVGVVRDLVVTLLTCTAPSLVGLEDGQCLPFGLWVGQALPATLGFGVLHALAFAVLAAPAVLLGGILLWMRRRARPLDVQVSGIIDV